jgi:hypothetical protein
VSQSKATVRGGRRPLRFDSSPLLGFRLSSTEVQGGSSLRISSFPPPPFHYFYWAHNSSVDGHANAAAPAPLFSLHLKTKRVEPLAHIL